MSARQRYQGAKGKRDGGAFIAIPVSVLNSCAYLQSTAHARMLLFDLAVQYRGNNNGDLSATWAAMQERGWRSKETLTRAKRELQELGLIVETRMGARPNRASLYALTWHALDECAKLEITARSFPRGAYKLRDPLPMPSPKLQALERTAN